MRLERGLSQKEVALKIRSVFQESLLWDFEAGDEKDIDGWLLSDYKKYCSIIGISPAEMVDSAIKNEQNLSFSELVRTRREEKRLTIGELSDAIGYDESVIESIENNVYEKTVCLDALKSLSEELNVPLKILLTKM
jgi:cytoskeletal protein RodZ